MRYNRKKIEIKIYISSTDIDETDIVSLYLVDNPSDTSGTFIQSKKGTLGSPNPSIGENSHYLFSFYYTISQPNIYDFYYTIKDVYGNKSDIIEYIQVDACLTPSKPTPIEYSKLSFQGNNSGSFDVSSNTVFQYKMNDSFDGTTVKDYYDNFDGTLLGGNNTEDISVTGKIKNGLNFSETDAVSTGSNLVGHLRNSFSVNFWLKPDEAEPSSAQYFIGVSDTLLNNTFAIGFVNSSFRAIYRAGGSASLVNELATSNLTTDDWQMITITVEEGAISTRIKIYRNQVLKLDSGFVGTDMDNYVSIHNVYVGALNNAGTLSAGLRGDMDEFRFFDRLLTTDEISHLYNSGQGTEEDTIDLSEEYQTIYHYNIDNPSNILTDGNYLLDADVIGLDKPSDGNYIYYREFTDVNCNTTSEASNAIYINFDSGTVSLKPLNNPNNLFINKNVTGSFKISFSYPYRTDELDPITEFNIYFKINKNPSKITEFTDISEWTLDGSLTFTPFVSKFTYISSKFTDGDLVSFIIIPVAADIEKIENPEIIEEFSDAEAPDITETTYIETTLI